MKRLRNYILYGTFGVSCVLPFLMVPYPFGANSRAGALYISAILGYLGVNFLVWMLLLGVRSISGLLPRYLTKTYHLHSLLGKYGTILIFLHPIFITISYGEQWFYSLVPHLGSEFETGIAYGQIALFVIAILWLTSAFLREKMGWQPWKYLHYLGYAALPFALLHIPNTGSNYAAYFSTRLYFFGLMVSFLLLGILWLRGFLNIDKQLYTIRYNKSLNKRVHILILQPKNDTIRLAPRRGQYIYLRSSFFSADHPFSVLAYNEASGAITLGIKVYGPFTRHITQARVNDTLLLSGPFGDFTSEIDDRPIVFVAGGIGITPFMERLTDENNQREQWLFYANRSPDEAVLEDTLRHYLGEQLVPLYDVHSTQSPSQYFNEAITTHLGNPTCYTYYLCGPAPLMNIQQRVLRQLGVPKSAIHIEDFSH